MTITQRYQRLRAKSDAQREKLRTWVRPEKGRPRKPVTECRVRQRIWARVRARALRDGIPFTIEPSDIPELPTHCPVLGIAMSYMGKVTTIDRSASLNRIVPELGYVPGNVRVISYRANRIKSDASLAELGKLVDWLASQMPKSVRSYPALPDKISELVAL